MKPFIFLFLCFLSCNLETKPHRIPLSFEGKVVAVKDGDTYEILYEGKAVKVRLEHIDCPEKGQPFGKAAKEYASELCYGKIARVESHGKTDRYQRLIAEVYIDQTCVNKDLLENGLAWHYTKYSKDAEYAKLEEEARKFERGLWADHYPSPPWEWRKEKRSRKE